MGYKHNTAQCGDANEAELVNAFKILGYGKE